MLLVALTSCDDTRFHSATDDVVGATGWVGVVELFEQACTSCHGGSAPVAGFDLEVDPCASTVGVVSTGYTPAVRVVPGDHADSVLWHKVVGTGTYGARMPLGASTASENVDLVADWIDAGAPCGADSGETP